MNFKNILLTGVAMAVVVGSASADVFNFDVSGISSFDEYGQPGNAVFNLGLGAIEITGIGWDVNVTAFDPSYISEMTFSLDNSTNDSADAIFVTPGFDTDAPGTNVDLSSGGILSFADNGLANIGLNADGILRLEFFEAFDDEAGVPDGIWNSGNLQIEYTAAPVPEPASMCALGLGVVGLLRARRNKKA